MLLPARSDFNVWLTMCHFILYSVQGFSSLPTFPVTNIHVRFPPTSSVISGFNYECPMTLWVPPIYECQNKNLDPQTLLAFELNIEMRKKKWWKSSENFTFLNSCRRDSASYPNSLHKYKKNKWKVNSIWQYYWDSHMPRVTVIIWEERMNIELSNRECLPKINHTIID